MILYHGGTEIITKPEIRPTASGRDFGRAFYCTDIRVQAEQWARRQAYTRKQTAMLNIYEFDEKGARDNLNIRTFNDYSAEWLNLILKCRNDSRYVHGFDIVYGKIANDDVGETVQAVLDGLMPFDFALQKLAFMLANNQYGFCTEKALSALVFIESIEAA